MSVGTHSLEHRVDASPTTLLVAVGDLLLIGAFVVAGELQHGVNPATQPWIAVDTYVPFLLAWLGTSLLGGLHTVDARTTPKRAVAWTVPAWIAAALVAILLRATALFHGSAAPAFFLVSVGVGLALLVPWRAGVAWLFD
jgi:hypothetical protein